MLTCRRVSAAASLGLNPIRLPRNGCTGCAKREAPPVSALPPLRLQHMLPIVAPTVGVLQATNKVVTIISSQTKYATCLLPASGTPMSNVNGATLARVVRLRSSSYPWSIVLLPPRTRGIVS